MAQMAVQQQTWLPPTLCERDGLWTQPSTQRSPSHELNFAVPDRKQVTLSSSVVVVVVVAGANGMHKHANQDDSYPIVWSCYWVMVRMVRPESTRLITALVGRRCWARALLQESMLASA